MKRRVFYSFHYVPDIGVRLPSEISAHRGKQSSNRQIWEALSCNQEVDRESATVRVRLSSSVRLLQTGR